MNESNPTLKKAYKILKQITKKLGEKNLHFSAQMGVTSDKGDPFVTYTAMIAPPAEGLEPVTFAAFTKAEFIKNLEEFRDQKANKTDVEIVYHEASIILNDRSTAWHKEQIDALQNPAPAEPTEAELVESTGTPNDTVEESLDNSDA